MLKKTIKYTNYDGEEIVEDFYFNLSRAEIAEMQLRTPGGYEAKLQKVIDTKEPGLIVETFKSFIHDSYGVKSDDGKRFIKSADLLAEFVQKEAYSELFMELVTDEDAAAEFVAGIMPKSLETTPQGDNRSQPQDRLPKKTQDVELPKSDPEYEAFLAWKQSQMDAGADQSPT